MPTPPSPFAETPQPPYYVVTFSSIRTAGDHGYGAMADRMAELALQQPGCLGAESARDADGFGITNSYWADEESLKALIESRSPVAGDMRQSEPRQVPAADIMEALRKSLEMARKPVGREQQPAKPKRQPARRK